jgi:crotonobetaine/carnitine-CoA ligase
MRVEITATDLAPAALRRHAAERSDQVLLDHVDGRTATYAQVLDRCDRFAAGLRALGVPVGTPVGIFVGDTFECARAWLAVTSAGMVAVPMNAALLGRTLEHVVELSGMRAVVVEEHLIERFSGLAHGGALEHVIVVGSGGERPAVAPIGGVAIDELLRERDTVAPFRPELHDIAMFLFTSGTTGPAKAVVIPWAAAHSHWSQVPADTLGPGEALYAPVAMFHNSGIGALQFVVWKGGRLVLREKFSASAFWDDVRRSGAVASGIVGPMTAVLWAQPRRADDADNPLRSLVLGPMIEQMDAFEQRFGTRVCTSYGMTEVPSMIATGWDHGPWQTCGTVCDGWPWPEVELVDEHDNPVPDGVVGQLVVRTRAPWALNAGYHRDPAATAEAWRNGWFHTGDAFTRDGEGRYYFVDRMKDTIRRRGENISSFEVEGAVSAHEAVAECAAYAVPDGYGGDDVMVAIVTADPSRPPQPADLFEFLEATMPAHMIPRYVDVVSEIPRNATTLRVQKYVLRDRGITATTWDRTAPSGW